ncbi:outer dense fiber protein 3B isoform X1 [Oenanthe melanoleuca]|uniref:outer dense fiber protein 3B isoform X1 n=1 Tax=Oenanthe melanoleuca TaxID=2939378 RepID=UPI0024C1DC90|nr:outer dense fiber protein 3B isoform X1 [Oenanthe melanoleuca]
MGCQGCVRGGLGVHPWGVFLGCIFGVYLWDVSMGCIHGMHPWGVFWGVFMGYIHGMYFWGIFMGCIYGVYFWGVSMGCIFGVYFGVHFWGVFMGYIHGVYFGVYFWGLSMGCIFGVYFGVYLWDLSMGCIFGLYFSGVSMGCVFVLYPWGVFWGVFSECILGCIYGMYPWGVFWGAFLGCIHAVPGLASPALPLLSPRGGGDKTLEPRGHCDTAAPAPPPPPPAAPRRCHLSPRRRCRHQRHHRPPAPPLPPRPSRAAEPISPSRGHRGGASRRRHQQNPPMSKEGWVGAWRPHRPRVPVAGRFRSPGPQYGLPSGIGESGSAGPAGDRSRQDQVPASPCPPPGCEHRDPSALRAPGYTFGLRLRGPEQPRSPGPQYLVPTGVTARGRDRAPAFTMSGRARQPRAMDTPGPAYYSPELADRMTLPSAPACTVASRARQNKPQQTPGPGSYQLPPVMGPNQVIKKSAPQCTMTGRAPSMFDDKRMTPGPSRYGTVDTNVYMARAPRCTIAGRSRPRPILHTPGPCDYSPKQASEDGDGDRAQDRDPRPPSFTPPLSPRRARIMDRRSASGTRKT